METATLVRMCPGCENPIEEGAQCDNIECPEVQARAVVGATQEKAKSTTDAGGVTAKVIPTPEPRAFNITGRVD